MKNILGMPWRIYSVAQELSITELEVEDYLRAGHLIALMEWNNKKYKLLNYKKIKWEYDEKRKAMSCDLKRCNVTLLQISENGITEQQEKIDLVLMRNLPITQSEIIISSESVEKLKNKLNFETASYSVKPPYLDPENKYYAPELAAAVEVWLELYEGGRYTEKKAPKMQLKGLLKNKGFSNDAMERIATVANFKKLGGATKTS